MDSTRFDELTKALVTLTSRRQALKALAATAVGGFLSISGIGTVFAKKKTCQSPTESCHNDKQCCSGTCCEGICCGQGQVCSRGICVCAPGTHPGCGNFDFGCNGNPECFCGETTEGTVVCVKEFSETSVCTQTSDCPAGYFCVIGCVGTVCVAAC
jgi:hypothetical protein